MTQGLGHPSAGPAAREVETRAITHSVEVEIMEARGLRNSDLVGTQQPYVTCEVEGKPNTRCRSALGDHPKDPKWNYIAKVGGYQLGDALLFMVYDIDEGQPDDVLGTATLLAEQMQAQVPVKFDEQDVEKSSGLNIERVPQRDGSVGCGHACCYGPWRQGGVM